METVKLAGTPMSKVYESTVEAGLTPKLQEVKKVKKAPKRKLTKEEDEARTTATLGIDRARSGVPHKEVSGMKANPILKQPYAVEGGPVDTTIKGSAFFKPKGDKGA